MEFTRKNYGYKQCNLDSKLTTNLYQNISDSLTSQQVGRYEQSLQVS